MRVMNKRENMPQCQSHQVYMSVNVYDHMDKYFYGCMVNQQRILRQKVYIKCMIKACGSTKYVDK